MKRLMIKHTIPLLLFSGALAGCIKDNGITPSGGESPVTVFVMSPGVRSGETTDPNAMTGDYEIVDFRVMVFKSGDGTLVRNTYVEDIWTINPKNRIEVLDIMTGVYDFLFIANEKAEAAGSELNTRLNDYDPESTPKHKLASVLQESFPYSDFAVGRPIPMTALYRNVTVSGDNTLSYSEDGEPRRITDDVWPVQVQRLGVRLDLTLKTNDNDLINSASGLTIRVPKKVYLLNDKNGATYTYPNNAGLMTEATTEISIAYGGSNGTFSNSGDTFQWTLPRIILPENTFYPLSDEGRALRVGIHFNGNISSLYGSVTFDRERGDYTAPRNYIYSLTGFLSEAIRFDGTVVQWGENESPETDLSYPINKLEPESNCYVVEPDGNPIGIPVSRVADYRLAEHIDAGLYADLSKLRADVLWSDTPGNGRGIGKGSAVRAVRFVNTGTLAKSYILATPGDVDGNSVVMFYMDENGDGRYNDADGDVIVYSWHIWVSYDKQTILKGMQGRNATTGETLYWMDRNLGAKYNHYVAEDEAGVMGLQYQYGRKDPFPGAVGFSDVNQAITKPVYGVQAPLLPDMVGEIYPNGDSSQEFIVEDLTSIAGSIQNPARWYCSSSTGNWCTDLIPLPSLWNAPAETEKSIFDPCPQGWKMPVTGMWEGNEVTKKAVLWSGASAEVYGVRNNFYGGYYPCALMRIYGFLINEEALGIRAGLYWLSDLNDENSALTNGDQGVDYVVFHTNPFEELNSTNPSVGYGHFQKSFGMNIRCVKSLVSQ